MTRWATGSSRERRVLIGGAFTVVAGLVFGRGFPLRNAWVAEQRREAAAAVDALSRARTGLDRLSDVRDSLTARAGRYLALAPTLLGGQTPAASGASLASLVSGAALTAGLRMGSIQIHTDTAGTSPFVRVSVRGDANGDIRGATAFFAALERGPVVLAVRHLVISQPEIAAPPDKPESLRIELIVEGLAVRRGRQGAAAGIADSIADTVPRSNR